MLNHPLIAVVTG